MKNFYAAGIPGALKKKKGRAGGGLLRPEWAAWAGPNGPAQGWRGRASQEPAPLFGLSVTRVKRPKPRAALSFQLKAALGLGPAGSLGKG